MWDKKTTQMDRPMVDKQVDGWMDEQCMDIKVLIKNGGTQKTPTRAAVEVKMLQKRVKG